MLQILMLKSTLPPPQFGHLIPTTLVVLESPTITPGQSPSLFSDLKLDNEQAGHLMSNLDWPGAVEDVKGAITYLKSVGCVKVCIQYC
jgi:hypothetical protein